MFGLYSVGCATWKGAVRREQSAVMAELERRQAPLSAQLLCSRVETLISVDQPGVNLPHLVRAGINWNIRCCRRRALSTMETAPLEAAAPAEQDATDLGAAALEAPSTSSEQPSSAPEPELQFTIVYGKTNTPVSRPASSTVAQLKASVQERLGIPAANQKLLCGGKALKDDSAELGSLGLQGKKVMLLGSSPAAIPAAAGAAAAAETKWDSEEAVNEPMSKQKQHTKVLEKGVPEDALPSVKGKQVPLADEVTVIPGLLNSQGVKVRLTFKTDLQQLWVASATTTQKVPYSTITKIEAFPIDGQEEYSILALHLGSGSSSKYWLYFFPSQHTAALKIRILGLESLL